MADPQIIQGTTPQLAFKFDDITVSSISAFEMTLSDRTGPKLTKTNPTYSGTDTAIVSLTQTETLGLTPGFYDVQVRVKLTSGTVSATPTINIEVIKLNATGEI